MSEALRQFEDRLGQLSPDSWPFTSRLTPEYTRDDLARFITPANILFALHRARQAREQGISHRGFKVGAALFGFKFSPAGMLVTTGHNIKPTEDSITNIHAEDTALKKLATAKLDAVSIVAVVGNKQDDQQSGKPMETLHPCGICRETLDASPLVDNDATLIVTALPDFRTIELSSVTKLYRYHEEDQRDAVKLIIPPDLSILKPVETNGATIQVEESEQVDAEDKVWHDLLWPHLPLGKA